MDKRLLLLGVLLMVSVSVSAVPMYNVTSLNAQAGMEWIRLNWTDEARSGFENMTITQEGNWNVTNIIWSRNERVCLEDGSFCSVNVSNINASIAAYNLTCNSTGSCSPNIAYLGYDNVGNFTLIGIINFSGPNYLNGTTYFYGPTWFSGDALPDPSLTWDLGSGTNRWQWLYVTNISTDYLAATRGINTSGYVTAAGNVTAQYFIGNISQATGLTTGNCNVSGSCAPSVAYMDFNNSGDFNVSDIYFNEHAGASTRLYHKATNFRIDSSEGIVLDAYGALIVWDSNSLYPWVADDLGSTTKPWGTLYAQEGNVTGTMYAHNYSGNSDTVFVNGTGFEKVRITEAGDVGIGTNNPTTELDIDDGGGVTGSSYISFNDRVQVGYDTFGTAQYGLILQGGSGKGINFRTNNIERMTLNSAGNLGIGTTTPGEELQVIGDISLNVFSAGNSVNRKIGIGTVTTGALTGHWGGIQFTEDIGNNQELHFWTSSAGGASTEKLTILKGGEVGIGTTTPREALDVIGNVVIDSAGDSNIFVGVNSGLVVNASDAIRNVCLGDYTCDALTTGDYNTALGYQAGSGMKTTQRNTYVGYGAGRDGTGSYNAAVGYMTMYGVTGNYNMGLGHASLNQLTSGERNAGIGHGAMYSLTTGDRNIGIGFEALRNNVAGDDNIGIGYWTGKDNEGYKNVFIGNYAGDEAQDINSSVLIGYDVGGAIARNNVLMIDNSNTPNPLIYGEFDTNYLKINGIFNVTRASYFNGTVLIDNNLNVTGTVFAHNYSGNSDFVVVNNTGHEKVRITEAGYLGVGESNPQQELVVVGDVNVTQNFTGNQIYAQVIYHNHTPTLIVFASANVYYNMTFDTSQGLELNGFTTDRNQSITAQVNGLYAANYMAIGDGQNNHKYVTTIMVNNIAQNSTESHKKMAAGGDILTMTGNGLIRLTIGDIISLGVADDGGTGDGQYYGMNLNLVRIGN